VRPIFDRVVAGAGGAAGVASVSEVFGVGVMAATDVRALLARVAAGAGSPAGDASVSEACGAGVETSAAVRPLVGGVAFPVRRLPVPRARSSVGGAPGVGSEALGAAVAFRPRRRVGGVGRRLRIGRVPTRSRAPSATRRRQSWLTVWGRVPSPSASARAASERPSGDASSIRSTAARRSVGSGFTGRAIRSFPSVFGRGAGDSVA
jgi:hypothetical protein